MRILLVEDNRRLNHELKMSLVDEGYAVDTAFDGVEGQALAESTSYDVLILDILLPGKDGLEVCRDVRRQHLNAPILLLTARDRGRTRILAKIAHSVHVFEKCYEKGSFGDGKKIFERHSMYFSSRFPLPFGYVQTAWEAVLHPCERFSQES